jgi:hypothetical protein
MNKLGISLSVLVKIITSVDVLSRLLPKDIDNFITRLMEHVKEKGTK